MLGLPVLLPSVCVQGKQHRGQKESKGKWRKKVQKISQLLSVMDKMQVPGGLPFVSARDISACEDLLEAYFMQVILLLLVLQHSSPGAAVHLLAGKSLLCVQRSSHACIQMLFTCTACTCGLWSVLTWPVSVSQSCC